MYANQLSLSDAALDALIECPRYSGAPPGWGYSSNGNLVRTCQGYVITIFRQQEPPGFWLYCLFRESTGGEQPRYSPKSFKTREAAMSAALAAARRVK
jgi:hypothetical protein